MKTCEESGLQHICDEIVECLASGSTVVEGVTEDERTINARAYLEELLQLSGADYERLNASSLKKVLTMMAGREMKNGRDMKDISENIKRIARML
ncbi:MAG TPA: hypothetical protein ENN21_07065 [Spirochaetes bacterium]|nr:hypothetical protein [Spirochaetota bacterium]